MGVFEWVVVGLLIIVAGLLLCILFGILRLNNQIIEESFWIKDQLKILTKETEDIRLSLVVSVEDKINAIARNTDRIPK